MVDVYILKGQRRGVRPVSPRYYIDFEKYNAVACYGGLSLPRSGTHSHTVNYGNYL